ncbi:hypothetical protein SCALM49S_04605 [Streptomyces californicus]
MRSSTIAPNTYRNSRFPSRCSQLPCTNSAVNGVISACAEPCHSSAGITPHRSK